MIDKYFWTGSEIDCPISTFSDVTRECNAFESCSDETETDGIFRPAAAFAIRIAISPRLAINTYLNGGVTLVVAFVKCLLIRKSVK